MTILKDILTITGVGLMTSLNLNAQESNSATKNRYGIEIISEGPIEIYGKPVHIFKDTLNSKSYLEYDNKKYLLPEVGYPINLDDFIDTAILKKPYIERDTSKVLPCFKLK